MDIKRDMIYRDDVLQVKAEPQQMLSPLNIVAGSVLGNATVATTLNNNLATTAAGSNGLLTILPGSSSTVNGGLISPMSVNGLGGGASSFASIAATSAASITTGGKRQRPEEWLSSPSPGTVSGSVGPPLSPSPGPPSQSYTVISNGYPSPLSNGSYEAYSPNGKMGEWVLILAVSAFVRYFASSRFSFHALTSK